MKLSDYSLSEFTELLNAGDVVLPCGQFVVRIQSTLAQVAAGTYRLYADFPLLDSSHFVDFDVRLAAPSLLRRQIRPQVTFSCDGRIPFKPLPLAQAFPMLEWGLNWVISSHAHDYLVIHAAVIERDGHAILLSADPGSGKSTLCAALVHSGWRLLSDELALISLDNGSIKSIARPISLKNRSIDIIQALDSGIEINERCIDTVKGSVAHMRPPTSSVEAMTVHATPRMILFPKFNENSHLVSESVGKAHAFAELTRHCFNYALLGVDGFDAISRMLDNADVFRLSYSSLDQVMPEVERLWRKIN